MTPIYPHSEDSTNGAMYFIAGKEGTPNSSLHDSRNVTLLATTSLTIAILFGGAIGLLINQYLNNGMLSFGIFLLISFLLILFNKMMFQFQSQRQGKLVVVLSFIIFYLVLSIIAVAQLMTFYYLQPEINAIKKSESSISMFSAMIYVTEHLELEQKKSLQQFQTICLVIPFILSQTLLLINYLILRNRTIHHPEFQQEQMRLEIQQAIQKKQKEYINLFQNPASTDEFFEDGNSEQQRSETAQRLLQEIASLKSGLQHLD